MPKVNRLASDVAGADLRSRVGCRVCCCWGTLLLAVFQGVSCALAWCVLDGLFVMPVSSLAVPCYAVLAALRGNRGFVSRLLPGTLRHIAAARLRKSKERFLPSSAWCSQGGRQVLTGP